MPAPLPGTSTRYRLVRITALVLGSLVFLYACEQSRSSMLSDVWVELLLAGGLGIAGIAAAWFEISLSNRTEELEAGEADETGQSGEFLLESENRIIRARIAPSGNLVFHGREISDGPESHEWSWTFRPDTFPAIRTALGGGSGELVELLESVVPRLDRPSRRDPGAWVRTHGIPATYREKGDNPSRATRKLPILKRGLPREEQASRAARVPVTSVTKPRAEAPGSGPASRVGSGPISRVPSGSPGGSGAASRGASESVTRATSGATARAAAGSTSRAAARDTSESATRATSEPASRASGAASRGVSGSATRATSEPPSRAASGSTTRAASEPTPRGRSGAGSRETSGPLPRATSGAAPRGTAESTPRGAAGTGPYGSSSEPTSRVASGAGPRRSSESTPRGASGAGPRGSAEPTSRTSSGATARGTSGPIPRVATAPGDFEPAARAAAGSGRRENSGPIPRGAVERPARYAASSRTRQPVHEDPAEEPDYDDEYEDEYDDEPRSLRERLGQAKGLFARVIPGRRDDEYDDFEDDDFENEDDYDEDDLDDEEDLRPARKLFGLGAARSRTRHSDDYDDYQDYDVQYEDPPAPRSGRTRTAGSARRRDSVDAPHGRGSSSRSARSEPAGRATDRSAREVDGRPPTGPQGRVSGERGAWGRPDHTGPNPASPYRSERSSRESNRDDRARPDRAVSGQTGHGGSGSGRPAAPHDRARAENHGRTASSERPSGERRAPRTELDHDRPDRAPGTGRSRLVDDIAGNTRARHEDIAPRARQTRSRQPVSPDPRAREVPPARPSRRPLDDPRYDQPPRARADRDDPPRRTARPHTADDDHPQRRSRPSPNGRAADDHPRGRSAPDPRESGRRAAPPRHDYDDEDDYDPRSRHRHGR